MLTMLVTDNSCHIRNWNLDHVTKDYVNSGLRTTVIRDSYEQPYV